jgi:hypothetical protein
VETTHDALERLRQASAQGEPWSYSVVLADLGSIRSRRARCIRNLERKNQYGDARLVWLYGDDATPRTCRAPAIVPRNAEDADLRSVLSASGVSWARHDQHPAPAAKAPPPDPAARRACCWSKTTR